MPLALHPGTEQLEELRRGLLERLKELVEVLVVLASAKGQQRGVPEGRDWVEEVLEMPQRGQVRYRQPFGASLKALQKGFKHDADSLQHSI